MIKKDLGQSLKKEKFYIGLSLNFYIILHISIYTMKIRKATKYDIRTLDYLGFLFCKQLQRNSPLAKLKEQKYKKNKDFQKNYYYKHFSKFIIYILEEDNGEIVGYSLGKIINQGKIMWYERYGQIDEVYVLKKARGKGYASILIKELLKEFKRKNIDYVTLFAEPNSPIQQYYSKIGFDIPYYYMMKKL